MGKPGKKRRRQARRASDGAERGARPDLVSRANAVLVACSSPEFQRRVNAEVTGAPGDWIRDAQGMRKQVDRILDAMEVDHRDVELTFAWSPSTRKLEIWARPAPRGPGPHAAPPPLRAVGQSDRP
jgi:hypothetical protein